MNSAAAQDARRIKVATYIDSLPHLLHNGDRVDNYLDVKYLGHIVAGDGSDDPDLNNRIALKARALWRQIHPSGTSTPGERRFEQVVSRAPSPNM
jgi:hypothetical protein